MRNSRVSKHIRILNNHIRQIDKQLAKLYKLKNKVEKLLRQIEEIHTVIEPDLTLEADIRNTYNSICIDINNTSYYRETVKNDIDRIPLG